MRLLPVAILASLILGVANVPQTTLAAWSETGGSSVAVEAKPKFKIDRRSGRGLCTVKAPINLLAAPKAGSKVIDSFPSGGIMTYIGDVPKTDFAYIHPCNACEHGYVNKADFLSKITDCTR